jgi:hypothetical protein
MGVAWIAAEMIYFLAYSDPTASVALLSVFLPTDPGRWICFFFYIFTNLTFASSR